ncbi:isopeptide-forming domain-containing fimbrial protein [Candidatus Saccharibacteria bacterium]|nr:isopeptide-forming domain-containing fimbrial protein [Candidatus Saccharibacteria bacterium]
MKKIFQTKNRVAKTILAVTSSLAVITLINASLPVSAWGPERTTYTNESPAPYATFNSITNNAAVGDERNFVRVREAGTDQTFQDEIEVVPGKEYEVYIYYHNNAASNTNASGLGMATNTRVASAYPTLLTPNERGMVSGIISWSYVTPENPNTPQEGKVWDEAYLTTSSDSVVMRYKTGTAVIHNDGAANGSVLPTALFTNEGTPIGFNKLEGNLPGCAEYSGHITYTLIAENTTSDLDKKVSRDGENWSENITAKPGEIVTYKVTFKNTGNTELTNVIMKDTHDEGLSLHSGSTIIFDVNNVDGKTIDDIIDISGYNFGNIAPGALVQLIYQAKISNDADFCGKVLNNAITLSYNSEEQGKDFASVSVSCEPTPEECQNDPSLPGCQDCETNPDLPGCKNCKTNPEMEGCQELPNTGPLEIVMAVIIILGLGGGGYYLYRSRKTLKTVENTVSGKEPETKPNSPKTSHTNTDNKQPKSEQ